MKFLVIMIEGRSMMKAEKCKPNHQGVGSLNKSIGHTMVRTNHRPRSIIFTGQLLIKIIKTNIKKNGPKIENIIIHKQKRKIKVSLIETFKMMKVMKSGKENKNKQIAKGDSKNMIKVTIAAEIIKIDIKENIPPILSNKSFNNNLIKIQRQRPSG